MSMSPDRTTLEEVALEMGISEAFVEKDWFVTKIIEMLANNHYLDFTIVFTGGTSLSKAHKLIERFSEDIDFRVIAPSLDGLAGSKQKKALSDFKHHIATLLGQEFYILRVDGRDGNRHIMIDLAYSTVCEPAQVLRPHIKLELTLSALLLPSVNLPVSSFINEVARRPPEVSQIPCINPVENASDKLSALIWRIPSRIRGEHDRQPDVVRHLHDLAKLSKQALTHPDFTVLLRQTVERDENRAEAVQGQSLSEKLSKMIAILEVDRAYPSEYETFVHGMSYAKNDGVPSFNEALTAVKLIAEKVSNQ